MSRLRSSHGGTEVFTLYNGKETSIFANILSQIKQICVFFTHFKLWVAIAGEYVNDIFRALKALKCQTISLSHL